LHVASRAVSRELVNLATRVRRRVTYAPGDMKNLCISTLSSWVEEAHSIYKKKYIYIYK